MKKSKKSPYAPKPLEDIEEIVSVAKMITNRLNSFEINIKERVEKLEREVYELKK